MLATPPRIRAFASAVRRGVLARRRLLAALLAAVAVFAGLRAVTEPPPASVPVTVAARDLPAGSLLAAGDVTRVDFAPDSVPDGLADSPVGERLAAPVARGEPLTDLRLLGTALTGSDPERRAMPVRFPDSGQVALLEPGMRIDVLATDPQGGGAEHVAAAVVLTVPDPAEDGAAGSSPGRLVVLGVTPEAVETVARHSVVSYLSYAFSG